MSAPWKTILLVASVSACIGAVTASLVIRRTHEAIRASIHAARAAHEAEVSRLAAIEVLTAEPDPAVVTDADARERIKATGKPWKIEHSASGIVMLLVPLGEFMMGERDDATRQVIPKAFYLSQNEVSNAEWRALTGTTRPGEEAAPVEMVACSQIHGEFLSSARGLRLPSEAEWEYACKAGSLTMDATRIGSTDVHPGSATQIARGSLSANPWGFHDMNGSVSEWVEGEYAEYPGVGVAMAVAGAAEGSARVLRSGGWNRGVVRCRIARDPDICAVVGPGDGDLAWSGFRVARDAE